MRRNHGSDVTVVAARDGYQIGTRADDGTPTEAQFAAGT
jgi:hypothetical protein